MFLFDVLKFECKKRQILASHVEVTNFKKLSFSQWLSLEPTRTHDSGIRECCLELSSSPLCRNICHLSVTKVAFDLRSDFFFSALSCFCSSLNDLEGAFVLFLKSSAHIHQLRQPHLLRDKKTLYQSTWIKQTTQKTCEDKNTLSPLVPMLECSLFIIF